MIMVGDNTGDGGDARQGTRNENRKISLKSRQGVAVTVKGKQRNRSRS